MHLQWYTLTGGIIPQFFGILAVKKTFCHEHFLLSNKGRSPTYLTEMGWPQVCLFLFNSSSFFQCPIFLKKIVCKTPTKLNTLIKLKELNSSLFYPSVNQLSLSYLVSSRFQVTKTGLVGKTPKMAQSVPFFTLKRL